MAGSIAEGVYKIGWAGLHLQRLDSEIGRYLNGERGIQPVQNYQANGHTVLFEIPNLRPPPQDLSLIIGDCLYNLRAALDYLAWQLVLAHRGRPNHRTQFPIYDTRLTPKGRSRRIEPEGGVDAPALAVLESLQPYQRGHDAQTHPLAVLQRLSNIDKHRQLHIARGATTPFLPEHTNAVSLLDRLLHHAVVMVTAGESFRMKEAKSRGGGPKT